MASLDGPAPPPAEFEISGADGAEQHGSNGRVTLTVFPVVISRLRKRISIMLSVTSAAHRVQGLYGELDGVRAYLHDDGRAVHVILTKRDLYP